MPDPEIVVGPDIKDPTHHVALTNRDGVKVGLIMCGPDGRERPRFKTTPVERTALKTTSGSSSYDAIDYPYSPIVQDDWSGGRANLDFERDTTKYLDANRMRTSISNKMFHGPQEQYTKGYRAQDFNVPGNVQFHTLTDTVRTVTIRFQASAAYTAALAGVIARRRGAPGTLRISIYSDSAGSIGTEQSFITVASTRLSDILSEWLAETFSQALTSGTYYWFVVQGNSTDDDEDHWDVGVSLTAGTTYVGTSPAPASLTLASFNLYFMLLDADATETYRLFEYREQQYVAVSGISGAPKLYMNGWRGAADSNSGTLNKLKDATQTGWGNNAASGAVALLIAGPGSEESQPWRVITASASGECTVSPDWLVAHTTSTEYVILGSNLWNEILNHGLTAPITDILVSRKDVLYVCQGDKVFIRRFRARNNAGTWEDFDNANSKADETTYAIYMSYKPQADRLVKANNTDNAGLATVQVAVDDVVPPDWGTAITWPAGVDIGSKSRLIRGLLIYPDTAGNEAIYAYKDDLPWIVPGTGAAYPVNLPEMAILRSEKTGKAHVVSNVYQYFSLGNGITRYYGGNFDEVGPGLGEGLPSNRTGPVIALIAYPGKFFAIVDGGASGYSSVLAWENGGMHEFYRAPKGQRITAASFQPVPGTALSRMWLCQGNEIVWLAFPSDTVNELQDSNYLFTHEASIVFSRMHGGMFDVQKLLKVIRMQSENLSDNLRWAEIDYKLDNDTGWTTLSDEQFSDSPTDAIDLTPQFGIAGKQLLFRIRSYTKDASKSPIYLAFIAEAVLRTAVKYIYPITFRAMDNEPTLQGKRMPDTFGKAIDKINLLSSWADSSSDSMLKMEATDRLWHGKTVFLNPLDVELVTVKAEEGERFDPYNVYVCTASLQDA